MTLGDAAVGSTVIVAKIERASCRERSMETVLTNVVLWIWESQKEAKFLSAK